MLSLGTPAFTGMWNPLHPGAGLADSVTAANNILFCHDLVYGFDMLVTLGGGQASTLGGWAR